MNEPSTPPPGGVFVFRREDLVPLLAIVLLPIVLAFPQLTGLLEADPLVNRAHIATDVAPGPLRGAPYLDPNDGVQTQALGMRAARDWLKGIVPWWNHYSGVGLPLAAEYQPGAFFPLTLLVLLPKGMLLQHLCLQLLAGVGTYGLLRQMGLGRLAATTGGLLFAFNGVLAWFAHGPAQPVPFLPWMLWGIERAFAGGGWRMLAAAMAMSLLAGFPETAYISGLLALGWAIVRGVQSQPPLRMRYTRHIALGGITGIALAAPQVASFFQYLPLADIGGHGQRFANEALGHQAIVSSLVAPYFYGPIAAYSRLHQGIHDVWGMIGGYTTVALVGVATYGFLVRRNAITWLLASWCVIAWMKTFGLEPGVWIANAIPGITHAAFYRYAPPSWELALVILAAFGIDALARGESRPRSWAGAAIVVGSLCAIAWTFGYLPLPPPAREFKGLSDSMIVASVCVLLSVAAIFGAARFASPGRRAPAIAVVLVFEAVLMYVVPTLANPRAGTVDHASIRFLRDTLGLQRVFSLGPMTPNYGAYFGLAAINHNYLPLARRWQDFVQGRLDKANNTEVFDGMRHWGERSSGQQLGENLEAYREVGVKYVLSTERHPVGLPVAYKGASMTIYHLPGHAPYFEATGSRCRIEAPDRTSAEVTCDGPAMLVRRELFFPGWSSRVNGQPVVVAEHGPLFQAIALPAGRSEVRFSYAPPHIGWAWLCAALAAAGLLAPVASHARRRLGRARPIA